MSETEIINTPLEGETNVPEEVIVPPVTIAENAPPELPEQEYVYQPTDADGRPIGGKQVLRYRTQEDLIEALKTQSVHQIRKMREQERKLRLGIFEEEVIDATAAKFQQPQEFKKRVLTPEERLQLSQDILDPEHVDRAIETVFEASIGTSPDILTRTITTLQSDNVAIKAQRESDIFMARNPEYVRCPENAQAIAGWVERYGLAPTADNFQKAYNTLKEANILVTSLEVVPTVVPPAKVELAPIKPPAEELADKPVEAPSVLADKPATPQVRIPSGINNRNSSNAGQPMPNLGDDIVYEYIQRDGNGRQVGEKRVFRGLAAIDAMPGEEYKRRLLQDPSFAKKVEKLEKEASARRRS